jgi:hypothetical protein
MQQEWYEENGRWYHAWQKGLYMYPHDEVSRVFLNICQPTHWPAFRIC